MKAGIVIDTWKRSIFERHLRQAGYDFDCPGPLGHDTLLLRVDTPYPEALHAVVAAANGEAARTGRAAEAAAREAERVIAAASVDRSKTELAGGGAVTGDHRDINPATGQQKGYVVLSAEERSKGFIRPVRRSYVHLKCGAVTTMAQSIAETYARDPGFYSGTFCCGCRVHLPLSEFRWDGTDEVVGS